MQRWKFTGGGDHEESLEELGLLQDVEQCVKSAEAMMTTTNAAAYDDGQSSSSSLRHVTESPIDHWPSGLPPWTAPLPVRNGSSVAPSQTDSKTDDQPSDDSEGESIVDPEPDLEAGFSPEVYSSLIANLQQDLRNEMNARDFRKAESTYRTIVQHGIDRERNLGIPFDNRSELSEKLADIYLNRRQYHKAKRVLGQLLREESSDTDQKWRLYLSLASAYHGLQRLDKAFLFAQRSLRGREELFERHHSLTRQSATLVIDIYEQQGEHGTADVLRRIYCPHTLPPPPPKSALRSNIRRKTPSPPPSPQVSQSPQQQSPPGYQEDNYHQNRRNVQWAPDVWVNDSALMPQLSPARRN